MSESLMQTYADGHALRHDRWQYIVCHPYGCRNAQRGGGSYAKQTYLLRPGSAQAELAVCHLPTALP